MLHYRVVGVGKRRKNPLPPPFYTRFHISRVYWRVTGSFDVQSLAFEMWQSQSMEGRELSLAWCSRPCVSRVRLGSRPWLQARLAADLSSCYMWLGQASWSLSYCLYNSPPPSLCPGPVATCEPQCQCLYNWLGPGPGHILSPPSPRHVTRL